MHIILAKWLFEYCVSVCIVSCSLGCHQKTCTQCFCWKTWKNICWLVGRLRNKFISEHVLFFLGGFFALMLFSIVKQKKLNLSSKESKTHKDQQLHGKNNLEGSREKRSHLLKLSKSWRDSPKWYFHTWFISYSKYNQMTSWFPTLNSSQLTHVRQKQCCLSLKWNFNRDSWNIFIVLHFARSECHWISCATSSRVRGGLEKSNAKYLN